MPKPKTKPKAAPAPTRGAPYHVGANYFIRSVTMYYTGRLIAVTEHELVLEDASWIASTGRFADAFKQGAFDEVEPFPDGEVIIGRGAIVDACQWPRELPR